MLFTELFTKIILKTFYVKQETSTVTIKAKIRKDSTIDGNFNINRRDSVKNYEIS